MTSAITGNKLLHHPERISGDFRPITADVFLTNYCNNKCGFCTYGRWERSESYSVKYTDFCDYADRLIELGVKGIILSGGGEPTVNRDFDAIAKYLETKGIHYGINTNFNILKYIKPDYLKVSLDGWDEDSYESIRGVRAYEKARANIIAYAEWKKTNSKTTSLGIQMIPKTYGDVLRFYAANKDLPVDYIVYRPIESTCGNFYKDSDHLAEAKLIINSVKRLSERDNRVVMNFKWDYLDTSFDSCVAHWSQIAIDEHGNVIYCCHKPYEKIGHIMDPDILEKHAAAHTNMEMCDIPCRLTAPNLLMQAIATPGKNEEFI